MWRSPLRRSAKGFAVTELPLTARQLRLLEPTLGLAGRSESMVTHVAVDSRECRPGTLFVALKGDRTDGHRFIPQAIEAGAAAVLMGRSYWALRREGLKPYLDRTALLVAQDPLRSLQAMARSFLAGRRDLRRIGVTGSSGKTTTKEIVASVLGEHEAVYRTPGNLNSDIGLPLAALGIKAAHKVAVLEMGINRIGEMDELVDIFRPQWAVFTNIGSAHIGIFKSRRAIAEEKRKILNYAGDDGVAYIPEDEEFLPCLTENFSGRVLTYGETELPGYHWSESRGVRGWDIRWEDQVIRFPLMGRHNLKNALCGIRVGQNAGVPAEGIRRGLEEQVPLFGRGGTWQGPWTLVEDYYNANPESMREAVAAVLETRTKGRLFLVLGDMGELGAQSGELHKELVAEMGRLPAELYLLGERMEQAREELARSQGRDLPAAGRVFRSADKLVGHLRPKLAEGDLVLIKGSRSMAMEGVAEGLKETQRGERDA